MTDSKWLNNVGKVCTWQNWLSKEQMIQKVVLQLEKTEDPKLVDELNLKIAEIESCDEKEVFFDSTWKNIEITREFEALYKNRGIMEKHSDYLENRLKREFIKQDEFNKEMQKDISLAADFKPKKPGKYKFISHIINLPPQEFKENSKEPFASKKPTILEIRMDGKLKPYIQFMTDLQLSGTEDKPTYINIENEVEKINRLCEMGVFGEEERDAKLAKIRFDDGSNNYWLLYRGHLNIKK